MDHWEGSELSLRWISSKTQRASGWGKVSRVDNESGEPTTEARGTEHGAEEGLQWLPEAEARNTSAKREEGVKGEGRPEELR